MDDQTFTVENPGPLTVINKATVDWKRFYFSDLIRCELDVSDMFAWGCVHSVPIDRRDLEDLRQIHDKYGDVACIAYASLLEGYDPSQYLEDCPEDVEDFHKAKKEISEAAKCNDSDGPSKFLHIFMAQMHRDSEIRVFGNLIDWDGEPFTKWENFTFFIKAAFGGPTHRHTKIRGTIQGTNLSEVDVTRYNVMEKLRILVNRDKDAFCE